METPNEPKNEEKKEKEEEEIILDKNNPDSIYNWVARKVSGPSFRNIIKDFIDDNCSLFIDIEENTFQQGQIFNEFNQLLENILSDVLEEGGLTQEQFLEAAQRGLEDKKYKKYFDQLLNFGDYNFFKRCMTKRNYTLIKRFEEQLAQEKKEIEEQQLEQEKQKELEKIEMEKGIEKDKDNGQEEVKEETNKEENKEKTEKELEEERQRMLLFQMLNQEEEQELQEVIKQSLDLEEQKRRIAVIEEEELNRALKQSLLEEKKRKEKEEEQKKEEKKKQDYQISKNEDFLLENQPKEVKPVLPPPKKPVTFIASSNSSFQFSGSIPNKEEKIEKPTNIISANKGFDFQIQSNNNNFGISSQNIPEDKKENLIEENNKEENKEDNKEEIKEKRERNDIEYKDIFIKENKKPEIQKVEIQRKKEEIKEKKIFNFDNYSDKYKNNIKEPKIIEIEDNPKDENLIITNEIRTKPNPQPPSQPKIPEPESQKASDILKQTMEENRINENYNKDDTTQNNNNDIGGYDRLLISDDEDEEEKKEEKKEINIVQKPLANAFIDTKKDVKDINLGKVRIGKDGGNFLNNFTVIKNYQKGGIEQLENKLKQEQFQSVVSKPNEDDDYLTKLKEVEKEKTQKLKEYREKLIKMQKEKRENKAKETLSPEELIKLQRREQLAERLKAKRMKENNP